MNPTRQSARLTAVEPGPGDTLSLEQLRFREWHFAPTHSQCRVLVEEGHKVIDKLQGDLYEIQDYCEERIEQIKADPHYPPPAVWIFLIRTYQHLLRVIFRACKDFVSLIPRSLWPGDTLYIGRNSPQQCLEEIGFPPPGCLVLYRDHDTRNDFPQPVPLFRRIRGKQSLETWYTTLPPPGYTSLRPDWEP